MARAQSGPQNWSICVCLAPKLVCLSVQGLSLVCLCVQGLSSCTATTAAMVAAAGHLAFATGPPAKSGGNGTKQRGVGVGFHTALEASTLPMEVQQAMHWHEAREGLGHATTVRFVPYICAGVEWAHVQ